MQKISEHVEAKSLLKKMSREQVVFDGGVEP